MHSYGAPGNLRLEQLPSNPLGPNDLRIAVVTAAINPVDTKIRSGIQRVPIRIKLPAVLGLDVAGIVIEVGANVNNFAVGAEVIASLDYQRPGSYAQEVVTDASIVAPRPQSTDWYASAGLPLAGLTAYQSMLAAGIGQNDHVLIQAGSGGVGHLAVQVAKQMGATVTATCSTRNVEFVRALGADTVVDYTVDDYGDSSRPYSVIYDMLGGEHRERSLELLPKGGRFVTIVTDLPMLGKQYGPYVGFLLALWRTISFMVRATVRGRKAKNVIQWPNGEQLTLLSQWADAGIIRCEVDSVFDLTEIAAAHARQETGRARGKVIVVVDPERAGPRPDLQ